MPLPDRPENVDTKFPVALAWGPPKVQAIWTGQHASLRLS